MLPTYRQGDLRKIISVVIRYVVTTATTYGSAIDPLPFCPLLQLHLRALPGRAYKHSETAGVECTARDAVEQV